jgi:hypothetical protein
MLRAMKKSAVMSLVALSLVSLAGCPDKKPEESAPTKPAAAAAPANAPAASANAPKAGGGW